MLWGEGIAAARPATVRNREVIVNFILSLKVDSSGEYGSYFRL